MCTRFRATFLLVGFCLSSAANAGVNVGFTAQLGVPERIENPTVGQRISIPVRFQRMTEMKGAVVRFRYDPEVVAFVSFTVGSITPGAVGFPGQLSIRDDGFAVIEAGTTLLGKGVTVTTSGGLFGTFEFELIAELPDAGSPISVVRVEVNTKGSADLEDTDVLDTGAAPLRVLLVPVFRNAIFNVVVERKHNGATLAWNTRLPG
ncbi:MAG: hypothetical protein VCF24_08865, partial [Candidatus Latescibacterota bacterium]